MRWLLALASLALLGAGLDVAAMPSGPLDGGHDNCALSLPRHRRIQVDGGTP